MQNKATIRSERILENNNRIREELAHADEIKEMTSSRDMLKNIQDDQDHVGEAENEKEVSIEGHLHMTSWPDRYKLIEEVNKRYGR